MKKLLWAAIFLVGCGIPNDKPIGELSDDEKDKICDKVEASSDTCTVEGVEFELRRSKATCLDSLDGVRSACSFTVGEWEDCQDQPVCDAFEDSNCELPPDCL